MQKILEIKKEKTRKMEELELICESMNNEIEELEETLNETKINKQDIRTNINNLKYISDKIYSIFESKQGLEEELQELEAENETLKTLLLQLASNDFQLLLDLKLKYNIYE